MYFFTFSNYKITATAQNFFDIENERSTAAEGGYAF